jgi:hypothetical protein
VGIEELSGDDQQVHVLTEIDHARFLGQRQGGMLCIGPRCEACSTESRRFQLRTVERVTPGFPTNCRSLNGNAWISRRPAGGAGLFMEANVHSCLPVERFAKDFSQKTPGLLLWSDLRKRKRV